MLCTGHQPQTYRSKLAWGPGGPPAMSSRSANGLRQLFTIETREHAGIDLVLICRLATVALPESMALSSGSCRHPPRQWRAARRG